MGDTQSIIVRLRLAAGLSCRKSSQAMLQDVRKQGVGPPVTACGISFDDHPRFSVSEIKPHWGRSPLNAAGRLTSCWVAPPPLPSHRQVRKGS